MPTLRAAWAEDDKGIKCVPEELRMKLSIFVGSFSVTVKEYREVLDTVGTPEAQGRFLGRVTFLNPTP